MRLKTALCLAALSTAACSDAGDVQALDSAPTQDGTLPDVGLAADAGELARPDMRVPPPCPDLDGDGFQDSSCNPNVANGGGDCDDTQPRINPGRLENCGTAGTDYDCNGMAADTDPACNCVDLDGDGYQDAACNANPDNGNDCDDQDPTINPGMPERCGNFKDDDCQGGDVRCFQNCEDQDFDGFGEGAGCRGPDCDDTNANINPWRTEICGDGVDQDCFGGDLICPVVQCVDRDRDGFGEGDGCLGADCDDANPNINPSAADLPNDGIDQDCSGADLLLNPACVDRDEDGYGVGNGCAGLDCDDSNPRINAGRTEVCGNGLDDDCSDGDRTCVPRESGPCLDEDGDGFGRGDCVNGALDCDESNPTINPSAVEVCNGVDDNCDGRVDECPLMNQVCDAQNGCTGQAGAPCGDDGDCAAGLDLYCDLDTRSCRVQDGGPCDDSAQCNRTAECAVLDVCADDSRCYQAKGGPCEESCDCSDVWLCNEDTQRCVECIGDQNCDQDDRDTCTDGGFCVEQTIVGAPAVDALDALITRMVACWDNFGQSNQVQGCDQLQIAGALEINGAMVASLGKADDHADYVCDSDRLAMNGFDAAQRDTIVELFGCGLFDIANVWWDDRLNAGSEWCLYYVPEKRGFGFPDAVRPAVTVERCGLSSFDD